MFTLCCASGRAAPCTVAVSSASASPVRFGSAAAPTISSARASVCSRCPTASSNTFVPCSAEQLRCKRRHCRQQIAGRLTGLLDPAALRACSTCATSRSLSATPRVRLPSPLIWVVHVTLLMSYIPAEGGWPEDGPGVECHGSASSMESSYGRGSLSASACAWRWEAGAQTPVGVPAPSMDVGFPRRDPSVEYDNAVLTRNGHRQELLCVIITARGTKERREERACRHRCRSSAVSPSHR